MAISVSFDFRRVACLLGLLLFSSAFSHAQIGQWVSAYYAGWQSSHLPPDQIDYEAFTHLLHFSIYPTGGANFDGTANGMTPGHMSATVQATHAAGKKAILSIGGWGSDFSDAVSPAYRAQSIANLVGYMQTYGYDGLDIDWEPVGDPPNFSIWVRDLRAAMNAFNPQAILAVAAFSYDQAVIDNQQYFDQINLMTYDYSGPYPGWVSWHNSPIYDGGYRFPSTGGLVPSANGSIDDYVAAGVAPTKLGIGIDFLGYYWTGGEGTPTGGVTAPRQSYTVTPSVRSNVQYYEIMNTYDGLPQIWDSSAHAAYISIDNPGSANDRFVSFDNERTMYAKAAYVWQKGIGGVIVFELGAGYRPSEPQGQKDFLLQAVKRAFIQGEQYVPDLTPPVVTLTSPSQGGQVAGTILLSANASDNSGTVSIQFTIDGLNYRNALRGAPFSTTLNTWKLANGDHRIAAIARDRSGNADSSTVLITVNNVGTPPVVTPMIVYDEMLQSPFINSSWGSSVDLYNTAVVRSGSRSIKVNYLDWGALDFNSGNWQSPIVIDPTVHDTLQFDVYPQQSFDLAISFYNGTQVSRPVTANTWNRVVVPLDFFDTFSRFYFQRNLSGSSAVYFDNIMFTGFGGAPPVSPRDPDSLKPTVYLNTPAANSTISGVVTVGASASDNIGVVDVQFQIDGVKIGPVKEVPPYTASLNTWYFQNGPHRITATARDGHDNIDSASIAVVINNQGPMPNFDLIVYDDALLNPFRNASWGATVNTGNTENVRSGTNSARVDFTGWGALDILSGTWGSLVPVRPEEFDSLQFYVYPTTPFDLEISFYRPSIAVANLFENQWNRVSIPIPTDSSFTRFFLRRNQQGSAIAYFDDIRFTARIPDKTNIDDGTTPGKTQLPRDFALEQNFPNPFNPRTTIRYQLPKESFVTLKVYNIIGMEIETLVDETLPAGYYSLSWNGTGRPSGVYFYRLEAGDFVETKKLILLK